MICKINWSLQPYYSFIQYFIINCNNFYFEIRDSFHACEFVTGLERYGWMIKDELLNRLLNEECPEISFNANAMGLEEP